MANAFFNDDGSVKDGLLFGDPYRDKLEWDSPTIAGREFDQDGYASNALLAAARLVVKSGTAHPNSVAAKLYHATVFANKTKGHYTPMYYWR